MDGRGVLAVQSDFVYNKVLTISPKMPSFPPEKARRQGRHTKIKRPIIIDYQSFALPMAFAIFSYSTNCQKIISLENVSML